MAILVKDGSTEYPLNGLAAAIVRAVVRSANQLNGYERQRVKVEFNRAGPQVSMKTIAYDDEVKVRIE